MFSRSAIVFCLFAAAASADVYNFDTTARGWYDDSDFNTPTNDNYLTGEINPTKFNSFFVFAPLTGLNGPITSATLYLFNPAFGYTGPTPASTNPLSIYGFTGDVGALETGGTVTGEFNALSSGTLFGTTTVGEANDNSFVAITLDAAAITFLNADGGSAFAFGGALSSLSDINFVFGSSDDNDQPADGQTYLSVVTTSSTAAAPEPRYVALMLLGLLAAFGAHSFLHGRRLSD